MEELFRLTRYQVDTLLSKYVTYITCRMLEEGGPTYSPTPQDLCDWREEFIKENLSFPATIAERPEIKAGLAEIASALEHITGER